MYYFYALSHQLCSHEELGRQQALLKWKTGSQVVCKQTVCLHFELLYFFKI